MASLIPPPVYAWGNPYPSEPSPQVEADRKERCVAFTFKSKHVNALDIVKERNPSLALVGWLETRQSRKPACTLALSPVRSRIKSSQRSTLISDHHLTICQRTSCKIRPFLVGIFNRTLVEIVEGGMSRSNPISEDYMFHDESKIFPNVRRFLVALQAL